ncbi:MAG: sulfatase [Anaerolineae bacterium]|jgi:arylsulfatase A-like enzyme
MRRPNIILILMDDLGWKDLSCYGSSFYETPNLDQLAARSVRFTDAYAACPVCSPTRASIMSGKYPARVGVTNFIGGHTQGRLVDAPYVRQLPLTEASLATALREGGYATWHVGKWHLGGRDYWPDRHGFEVNVGGCDWGMPNRGYFSPWGLPTLPDGPAGEYLPDRLMDEAIGLIERSDGRPFFLNYWDYCVHIPIQAKPEKVARYEAKARAQGLDALPTFAEGEPFPCEHKRDQRVVRRLLQSDAAYAAMIESVDENIGRLLQALEAAGQADDTIIIFTSDNGGLATAEGSPTCNAPLAEGKGWMYEGGTREPLFVHWPGVAAPGVCATPVTSPDLYPTILEMAGLPLRPQQHVDGVSLAPLLRGEGAPEREALYWHYPHYGNQGGTPGASLRAGDWKLIEFYEDGRLELYNLREDVSEERNRAAELPALAARLQALLAAWRESVAAQMPAPNPDYTPWR